MFLIANHIFFEQLMGGLQLVDLADQLGPLSLMGFGQFLFNCAHPGLSFLLGVFQQLGTFGARFSHESLTIGDRFCGHLRRLVPSISQESIGLELCLGPKTISFFGGLLDGGVGLALR